MKKTFLASALAALVLIPALSGAETITTDSNAAVTVETGTTTLAHIFTACSQASIEARDTAIAAARVAYNTKMAKALEVRKDAEKNAVAITDVDAKKEAILAAVETYKKAVTEAQAELTASRKVAWDSFEKDMTGCRQYKKDEKSASVSEKKAAATKNIEAKKEVKAEMRATIEAKQAETKTLRATLREQLSALRAFFSK